MRADDDLRWLTRLKPAQWVSAALTETERAYRALRGKHYRPGLTHARRAAGMAVNSMLVEDYDPRYGRSYVEHLQVLAEEPEVPAAVREAARALASAPIQQPALVTLGREGSTELAEAARVVVEWAARRLVQQAQGC